MGEADEVFRSEQRQAISTALKETKRPMSVAEIMAATERRDRNSTEVLLHKMERDGEVKHVGRGLWAHPDIKAEPTESVKIVKKVRNNNQGTDSQEKNGTDESYRNLNADETVKIPGKISKAASPLTNNGKPPGSYHLNDLTGSERADDPGPIPDCLLRAPPDDKSVQPPPTADVEVCAQCGAAEPGPLLYAGMVEGEVRLHRECVRFWLKAHPQPKGRAIPLVQITGVAAPGTETLQ